MNPHPLMVCIGFLIQWVLATVCFASFAFGCVYFGYKLERSAFFYASGQSQETLHALYESTKWAAIVEGKNRQIEMVCKRLTKKQRRNVCPEGV